MNLAVSETLALTPSYVFENATAFLLRQRGHNGDKQFSLTVKGVNAFFFKIALHAVLFQLSDCHKTVNRVSRKSADIEWSEKSLDPSRFFRPMTLSARSFI